MGDPNDEVEEDFEEDAAEQVGEPEEDEDDEDEDDDEAAPPAEAPPPLRMGTVHVAPSSDGSTNNVLAAPTSILVTVRRDFPLREGECLGKWAWSSPDGTAPQAPQRWTFDGEDNPNGGPPEAIELTGEDERPMIGWGIGHPRLGDPGDNARQRTTDRAEVIEATVRLVDEDGAVVSEGETVGKNGECRLDTARGNGFFNVEVLPTHAAERVAGPGMANSAPQLYRPSSIRIVLRAGRIVGVDDPYDPPSGSTHVRVGNRQVWAPTTTQLPLSLKPDWWKDLRANPRREGVAAVKMLVLHCTGGPRLGGALNQFFRPTGTAGANYLLDIDGHVIKLFSDDQMRVHAGVGFWRGKREIKHSSFGIEIVNPNAGNPDTYMAYARPQYTAEQYATLIRLCAEIVAAYPAIGDRIVGHCDVATGPRPPTYDSDGNPIPPPFVPGNSYGTKRNFDPGLHFEWERLEAEGLGMVPLDTFDAATTYAGIFGLFPSLRLDTQDADPRGSSTPRYGGEERPELPAAAVIAELQRDLQDIGYCVSVTGQFDARTFAATDRFRRHFARQSMPSRRTHGAIDLNTARRIHNAAQGVRQAALSSS